LGTGKNLQRPVVKREPGRFETTPASFPDYFG